ncbi:MAG: ribosome small subunit-dependent GTPase A [Thermoanaerobaculia bacterium]
MDRSLKRYLMDVASKQRAAFIREMKRKKGSGNRRRPDLNDWEEPDSLAEAEAAETIEEHAETNVAAKPRPKTRRAARIESEETAPVPAEISSVTPARRREGIVISVSRGMCRVATEEALLDCRMRPELLVEQQSSVAVGDRVTVALHEGLSMVEEVAPRRTVLSRPDPHDPRRERVVAANIDVVVHVVSLKSPPLRPRLIDRYLIAISRGGAQPAICVNKIDLVAPEELEDALEPLGPHVELGIPIVLCSSKSFEGIDNLRSLVAGRTAALVGHSGVGKSSILNALDTRLEIATGALHRKRGTGRHTTNSSTLYEFADGTRLVDTPGIREFGLWDLDVQTLRYYFPEFEPFAVSCRFNDCTHTHEPDCALRAAVENGDIAEERYDTYLRIAEDMRK